MWSAAPARSVSCANVMEMTSPALTIASPSSGSSAIATVIVGVGAPKSPPTGIRVAATEPPPHGSEVGAPDGSGGVVMLDAGAHSICRVERSPEGAPPAGSAWSCRRRTVSASHVADHAPRSTGEGLPSR